MIQNRLSGWSIMATAMAIVCLTPRKSAFIISKGMAIFALMNVLNCSKKQML